MIYLLTICLFCGLLVVGCASISKQQAVTPSGFVQPIQTTVTIGSKPLCNALVLGSTMPSLPRQNWTVQGSSTNSPTTLAMTSTQMFFSLSVSNETVQLAWNPSPDPLVTGYNIYLGPSSGTYTNVVPLGLVTNCIVSGLIPQATYYFTATDINAAGLESEKCVEIAYTMPVPVITISK